MKQRYLVFRGQQAGVDLLIGIPLHQGGRLECGSKPVEIQALALAGGRERVFRAQPQHQPLALLHPAGMGSKLQQRSTLRAVAGTVRADRAAYRGLHDRVRRLDLPQPDLDLHPELLQQHIDLIGHDGDPQR
ncbi:MAG: hypothetical protein MZV64_10360 [Ignavibacteriales bacterium]|nr:hypothetical protein [Ignavibacteriales bacterium]